MKFSCERSLLNEVVGNIQRTVSTKSNIPALEGILLSAENDTLSLTSFDYEIGMKTQIKANVIKEGKIVLKAKLLFDVVRRLSDNIVNFEIDEKQITYITCGQASYQIIGIAASEFPELPRIENSNDISIKADTLKDMIRQTRFALSNNIQKLLYTGSLFEIKDRIIKMVSLDGVKLALRKENIDTDLCCKFIVPGRTLNEILKFNTAEDENIILHVGKRHVTIEINNYMIISRLLEGNFIDYESTIPTKINTQFEIKTETLLRSVERVALLNTDKLINPVSFDIKNQEIVVSCSTTIGKATDIIDVPITGENVLIGFDHRYISEALMNVNTDKVRIEICENIRPVKIVPLEGDSFLFLVLPMRLAGR